MIAFKTKNISYEYNTYDKDIKVLQDITLEINKGDFVAITGASGSGKSTLLYLLGGILKCQTGELYIEDQDISVMTDFQLAWIRNHVIGFVYQQFFLLPKLTVLDNILLPTHYPIENTPSDTVNYLDKAVQIAKKLGIIDRLHHFPKELSGGEQQRVALARALMRSNNIILADEPTGNLDSENAQIILNIFCDLNKEGYTIIMVTHDLKIAELANKQVVLSNGRIDKVIAQQEITYQKHDNLFRKNTVSYTGHNLFKLITKITPITIHNILQDKVKLFSNILGIMIGIASIMAMITLGQFLKEKVLSSYAELGTDVLRIHGYPNWQMQAKNNNQIIFESFSEKNDLNRLKEIFWQITKISPLMVDFNTQPVKYGSRVLKQQNAKIFGVGKDFFTITSKKFISGKSFYSTVNTIDMSCVVGYGIANQLFLGNINPLEKIIIVGEDRDQLTCQIIGVLAKELSDHEKDFDIYLTHKYFTSSHMQPWLKEIHSFIMQANPNTEILSLGKAIEKYFTVKYKDTGQFFVDPNSSMVRHMNKFINLSTIIFTAMAVFSLTTGGIGIINMMLVSFHQRIKEIGVKKALGATNFSMKVQFLLETFWVCLIGGVLGILLGIVFYEVIIFVAAKFFSNIEFQFFFYPQASIISFASIIITALLCGIIPAVKAEKLDIIFALKQE